MMREIRLIVVMTMCVMPAGVLLPTGCTCSSDYQDISQDATDDVPERDFLPDEASGEASEEDGEAAGDLAGEDLESEATEELPGCTGDSMDSREFAAAMTSMQCGLARRCLPPGQSLTNLQLILLCDERAFQGWLGFAEQVLSPLLAAGEIVYSTGAMEECDFAFGSSCYHEWSVPDACQRVFTGCRAEGDPCTLVESYGTWNIWGAVYGNVLMLLFPRSGCMPGLFCDDEAAEGDSCGRCAPLPGLGERCAYDDTCSTGTTCFWGYCLPIAEEGESCTLHVSPSECREDEGITCVEDESGEGHCVRLPGRGEPCDDASGLHCFGGEEGPSLACVGGECVDAEQGPGEVCEGTGGCQLGLECNFTLSPPRCEPISYAGVGESCNNITSWCNALDLVCVDGTCETIVIVGLGEPCGDERQCAGDAYCGRGGICVPAAQVGETCYHLPPECDDWCDESYGCVAAEHTPCAAGAYCPYDLSNAFPPGMVDLCTDHVCTAYGSNPVCTSNEECGWPDGFCRDSCQPWDAQPYFHGPVIACE